MASTNNRQSFVSRMVNSMFGKAPEQAPKPAVQAEAVRPGEAQKLSSDEMYRRLTGNGASLPG